MDRSELTRVLILNAIAEEYEDLAFIEQDVNRCMAESHLATKISRSAIREQLADLIDAGLAKAYRLFSSGRAAEEIEGRPAPEEIDQCWFHITDLGALALEEGDTSFNEEGRIIGGDL
jgi:DNA-binding transcriptional ArsR family regulator